MIVINGIEAQDDLVNDLELTMIPYSLPEGMMRLIKSPDGQYWEIVASLDDAWTEVE